MLKAHWSRSLPTLKLIMTRDELEVERARCQRYWNRQRFTQRVNAMEQQQEQPQEPQRRVKYHQVVRFYQNAGIRRRNLFTTNSLAIAQGTVRTLTPAAAPVPPKSAKTAPAKSETGSTYETVYY